MRQPIRPFVTEYKSRSSKSRTSQWYVDQPETNSPKQPLIKPAADTPPVLEQDISYTDALAAADAVFGRKAVEPLATPAPSTGRILPCLLQSNEQAAAQRETPKRASRAPRAPSQGVPKTAKAGTLIAASKPVGAEKAAELSPPPATPDIQTASPIRERSSIQNQWVRKTRLKPGERWKRRLCEAAR